jgi:hypothetical protein
MKRWNSHISISIQLFFITIHITTIPSYASKPTPGTLTGKVVDSRGNQPLSDATVCLKELNQTTISDSAGMFRMQSLMPGIYTLIVTADGYDTIIVPNTTIKSKKNDLLTVSLQKTIKSLDKIVVSVSRSRGKKMDQFHSVRLLYSKWAGFQSEFHEIFHGLGRYTITAKLSGKVSFSSQ